ncbi:hypothetical protein GE09DRAFT_411827 [Coniochaeta sp. 2T2.1]|nr:hypothetical protein GE09DRAFT_411827 [Coniochaeta sp. 2T2.1]
MLFVMATEPDPVVQPFKDGRILRTTSPRFCRYCCCRRIKRQKCRPTMRLCDHPGLRDTYVREVESGRTCNSSNKDMTRLFFPSERQKHNGLTLALDSRGISSISNLETFQSGSGGSQPADGRLPSPRSEPVFGVADKKNAKLSARNRREIRRFERLHAEREKHISYSGRLSNFTSRLIAASQSRQSCCRWLLLPLSVTAAACRGLDLGLGRLSRSRRTAEDHETFSRSSVHSIFDVRLGPLMLAVMQTKGNKTNLFVSSTHILACNPGQCPHGYSRPKGSAYTHSTPAVG